MTFEEFWEEHQHDPYTGREDFLFTWNAALEEAAKVAYAFLADECPDNDYDSGFNDAANRIGDTISSLKEK